MLYLSYSKTKDLENKNLFYKKHILKEIPWKTSDAMLLGSWIDALLTNPEEAEKYIKQKPKDKNNNYSLTVGMYDKGIIIANKVIASEYYKDLYKFEKQKTLIYEKQFGIFKGIKGILDFLYVEGDTATIIDLKTCADSSPDKFKWNILNFNYYLQMAIYGFLVKKNYPDVCSIKYRILACQTSGECPLNAYELDEDKIKAELSYFLSVIEEQKKFTIDDFKKEPEKKGWDTAKTL